jgi:DNA repair exonuclease SbcCD nuclease subunit
MRFIHTADWQIGKPFRNFGLQESVLRHARLRAIETIGELAGREAAGHILVAGDLYDSEAPSRKTLLEPLERMRQFPHLVWHIIPGNHDPHRPNGLWDQVREAGIPANVRLHLAAEAVQLGETAMLLPSPLRRKSEAADLTEWMDAAETPPGIIRIGLAHGSVVGFGTGGEASNPVAPGRPARAGLDYLALGDWHRTMRIAPAVWYSGTPEPDRFASQEDGQALLVDIAAPGAPPSVTPLSTGTYRWLTIEEDVHDTADLAGLETRLRARPGLSSTIVKLMVKGTLPLAGRAELDHRLSGLQAATFHLDTDLEGLAARPTAADLEAIDFGGVLREAAETLKAMADDHGKSAEERRRAGDALVQLFVMTADRETHA